MRSHEKQRQNQIKFLIPMHSCVGCFFFFASLSYCPRNRERGDQHGEPSPMIEEERQLEKQYGQLQNLPSSTTLDHLNLTH